MLWCDKMHLQKVAEMQHALPKTSRRLRFNNVHKFVICSSPILLWTKLLQWHYIIQIGIIAVYFPHSIWWLNLTWGSTKRQIKNTNYFLNRYDFVISSLVYSKLINQFILKKKEEEARQKRREGKREKALIYPLSFQLLQMTGLSWAEAESLELNWITHVVLKNQILLLASWVPNSKKLGKEAIICTWSVTPMWEGTILICL